VVGDVGGDVGPRHDVAVEEHQDGRPEGQQLERRKSAGSVLEERLHDSESYLAHQGEKVAQLGTLPPHLHQILHLKL
jgi:hypothetical protein